jgi:hypothetical protein
MQYFSTANSGVRPRSSSLARARALSPPSLSLSDEEEKNSTEAEKAARRAECERQAKRELERAAGSRSLVN